MEKKTKNSVEQVMSTLPDVDDFDMLHQARNLMKDGS
jgi:hypothetical protein